jgi:hypothetical protein
MSIGFKGYAKIILSFVPCGGLLWRIAHSSTDRRLGFDSSL